VRQVEFKAYFSRSELKRLGQEKPSAAWLAGAVALALAWIFSAFGLSPSRLDFGTLQLGSRGRLPVHLTNRGMTEFHAASIALEGADAQDFEVDPQQSCLTVKTGESCVVWVDFRPRDAGEKHARLIVRAHSGNEFSSEFTGVAKRPDSPPTVATLPHPTPDPPPPAASAPPTHQAPAPARVVSAPAPTTQPTLTPPPAAPPPPPTRPPALAPPPTAPAPPPSPPAPPPPTKLYARVTMTPGITEFGSAPANAEFLAPSAHTITVISDGAADVRQLNLRTGLPDGPFSYRRSCPTYLARGQRCTVQVKLAARDLQPHTDSLSAYDGDTRLASVTLHSKGTVSQPPPGRPHLTFRPGEVQFPVSQSDGWVTVNEKVAVASDGTADVRQLNLKIAPNGFPFGYSGNCPTHLAQQQSCTLLLSFEQKSRQAYSGMISAYDGSTALASLPLRAGGGNVRTEGHPHVTMTPAALKFGGSMQYKAMYVPSRQSIEVRNDGTVDLRALNLRLAPSGAPFSFSNCSPTLARGQSCSTQVNFTPTNGPQSAARLIAYEGVVQLAMVQLYGAGTSAPPKAPGGSVTGAVDRGYPNENATPVNGARTGTPAGNAQNGIAPAAKAAPKSGTQSNNSGYRAVSPNREVKRLERQSQAAPPAESKHAPVRRAVPKPSPPSVH
jgi:hypothetical protein